MQPALTGLLVSVLAATGALASPQAQTKPQTTLVVVVFEYGSSQPIGGARIAISRIGAKFERTLESDSEGMARLDQLPPGGYVIQVTSPEHLSTLARPYRVPSQPPSAVERPGRAEISLFRNRPQTVRIDLPRQAAIAGAVLSVNGQGVELAPVEILELGREIEGRRAFYVVKTVVTDEQGNFRADGLLAGDYYLRSIPDPTLGRAVNHIFYPSAADSSEALPSTVGWGDEAYALVSGPAVRGVEVSGRVVAPGFRPNQLQVALMKIDDDVTAGGPARALLKVDSAGNFVERDVTRGIYALAATGSLKYASGADVSAVAHIKVGASPVRDIILELQPTAAMSGTFESDDPDRPPRGVQASLTFHASGELAAARESLARLGRRSGAAGLGGNRFLQTGLRGPLRIEVTSPGWIAQGIFLEDGTNLLGVVHDFRAGQVYENVRIILTRRRD